MYKLKIHCRFEALVLIHHAHSCCCCCCCIVHQMWTNVYIITNELNVDMSSNELQSFTFICPTIYCKLSQFVWISLFNNCVLLFRSHLLFTLPLSLLLCLHEGARKLKRPYTWTHIYYLRFKMNIWIEFTWEISIY